jgi:hypothetical protein
MSKTTKVVVYAMDTPLGPCDFMNSNSMAMVANLELSYNLEGKREIFTHSNLGLER